MTVITNFMYLTAKQTYGYYMTLQPAGMNRGVYPPPLTPWRKFPLPFPFPLPSLPLPSLPLPLEVGPPYCG